MNIHNHEKVYNQEMKSNKLKPFSKSGDTDNLFNELVKNAFVFLEKSLTQITAEPQFSLINYYTAIELFFKARLLKEHWTLIVSEKKMPDYVAFCTGDFQSISLLECAEKITSVCGEDVLDISKKFNTVRLHRNKAVHFFHPAFADSKDIEKNKIIEEQFEAWITLKTLLLDIWRDVFAPYKERIEKLEDKLSIHKKYLEKLYTKIKEDIAKGITKGDEYIQCPYCGYEAFLRGKNEAGIISYKCRVCKHKQDFLLSECVHCNETFPIFDILQQVTCPYCKNNISEEECIQGILLLDGKKALLERFNLQNGFGPKDCCPPEVRCCQCFTDNIIQISQSKEEYYCLDCGEKFLNIMYCEYCGTGNLGGYISEDESAFRGCEFCEGALGNLRDD